MARQQLYFTLPSPCEQRWENMTPKNEGRHCGACDKVIVNFSDMSDGELLQWFAARPGQNPCGIYRADQLNRTIKAPLRLEWLQRFVLAGALFFSGMSSMARNAAEPAGIVYVTENPGPLVRIRIFQEGTIPVEGARILVFRGPTLLETLTSDTGGLVSFQPRFFRDTLYFKIQDVRVEGSLTLYPAQLYENREWRINAEPKLKAASVVRVLAPEHHRFAGINPHDYNDYKPHGRFCRHRIAAWFRWLVS